MVYGIWGWVIDDQNKLHFDLKSPLFMSVLGTLMKDVTQLGVFNFVTLGMEVKAK